MSDLSLEQVAHVAKLARLELTAEESERFRRDLSAIVGYVDVLSPLDTSELPATRGVQPHSNVFRSDVATASLGAERVVANAPLAEDGAFQIPRILEEA